MDQVSAGRTPLPPGSQTSRRAFLASAGTVALGAAATTVGALAGTPTVVMGAPEPVRVLRDLAPITLTIYRSRPPGHDWLQDLITRFEQQTPTITVRSVLAPQAATAIMLQLSGGSSAIDLYQLDVIWPPVFAAAGWILPVERWLSGAFSGDLLPGPKRAAMLGGTMYAFPQAAEAGLLVYRRDLLSRHKVAPPQTWSDLVRAAQAVLAREPGVPYGLLWQGGRYEGLFCDICELFWGNGGSILQHDTGPAVVLDTPNNRAALQFLVDTIWRDKIAPLSVSGDTEEDTRRLWEQGQAVFMRYWSDAWALGQQPPRATARVVGITWVPHGPLGHATACLGGTSLVINAKSAHPDAAAKLALYLTSFVSQKDQAIKARLSPTRASVYADPDVLTANPWYRTLYPVLAAARLRPGAKDETGISDRVTRPVHDALLKQVDVPTALQTAQRDVAQLLSGTTP